MIICFVCLNIVLKIVLYLFNGELLLRFISGSPDPNNIKDFRPISLLNVAGKLFFSILPKQLEKHIYSNKLINSSIQKGSMKKFLADGRICQLFGMN